VKQIGDFVRHAMTKLLANKNGKGRDESTTLIRPCVAKSIESQNSGKPETIPYGIVSMQHEDDKTLELILRVYFFGKFQVFLNDVPIDHWSSRRGKELFAYLVFNHKRRVYRDVLMENFWPNSEPDSARNCLNVAIHSVRHQLHLIDAIHDYILFKDECYFLNPEIDIWLDHEEFLRHWRIGQSLECEGGRLRPWLNMSLPLRYTGVILWRNILMRVGLPWNEKISKRFISSYWIASAVPLASTASRRMRPTFVKKY
jgi:hypothetical protein